MYNKIKREKKKKYIMDNEGREKMLFSEILNYDSNSFLLFFPIFFTVYNFLSLM